MLAFLKNIGPVEIIVVVAILLLFFGSRVVKMLARSAGESTRELKNIKKSLNESMKDIEEETDKLKK